MKIAAPLERPASARKGGERTLADRSADLDPDPRQGREAAMRKAAPFASSAAERRPP